LKAVAETRTVEEKRVRTRRISNSLDITEGHRPLAESSDSLEFNTAALRNEEDGVMERERRELAKWDDSETDPV
jgi:hypothetical protein